MALLKSLSAGVTGLQNFTTMMDVIGNNVANINTIGFKGSRINFGELFSQTLRGATRSNPLTGGTGGTNPVQVGLGASIMSIDSNFKQGVIEATGNDSDLAIEGTGLFVVKRGSKEFYTRVGSFERDELGMLVMKGTGAIVQGLMANGTTGAMGASPQDIKIDITQKSFPSPTGVVKMSGNLDASADTYVPAVAGPPAVLASGGIATSTFKVFDSLGNQLEVTVTMTKDAAPNTWSYDVNGAVGTVIFDDNGKVQAGSRIVTPITIAQGSGAAALDITLDFETLSQTSGTAVITPSTITGCSSGDMTSWGIDQNGDINASFTNGEILKLGKIVLAQSNNPAGLIRMGDGLYGSSPNSGTVTIVSPGSESGSKIYSGSLEQSNVDLPEEFTRMIIAQRGFQANSRVITTSDEILNEVVNLKR